MSPKSRSVSSFPLTVLSNPGEGSLGKTGLWRTFTPQIDYDKCTKCLACWVFCPEAAIKRGPDDSVEILYDYCKGCGVCANECPLKIITMKRERGL